MRFLVPMLAVIVPFGIGSTLLMFFWIWAVFDVIATDSILVRNLSKGTWLLLVIFVPTVGALAWLLLGRPEGASVAPGGQRPPPRRTTHGHDGPTGLEDSRAWRNSSSPSLPSAAADSSQDSLAVRQRKLMEHEANLARREAELEAKEAALAEQEAALEATGTALDGDDTTLVDHPAPRTADPGSPADGDLGR